MPEQTDIPIQARIEGPRAPERNKNNTEGVENIEDDAKTSEGLQADISGNVEMAEAALQEPLTEAQQTNERLIELQIDASEIQEETLRELISQSIRNGFEMSLAMMDNPDAEEVLRTEAGFNFDTIIIKGTRQSLANIPGLGELTMFKGTKYKISPTGTPDSTSFTEIGTAQWQIIHENKTDMATRNSEGSSIRLRFVLVDTEVKGTQLQVSMEGGAAFEGKVIEGLIDKKMSPIGGVKLGVGPATFKFNVAGFGSDQVARAMLRVPVNERITVHVSGQGDLHGPDATITTGVSISLPKRKK